MNPQSKSSLETLKDCAYKYGQIYILGKRGAPSKAAQAGSHVHKRLEVWRETGAMPDPNEEWEDYRIGEIALAMLATLPPYGTEGIVTEKDETFTINGYEYRAIKDWQTEEILGDYKTTARLSAKHVLTEETIVSDLQATLSARHMDRDLTLWWTYGQSQGNAKVKTVKLRVLKNDVRDKFLDIVEPLTVSALAVLEQNDPENLPKNKESCFKYGRCAFYNTCWLTPSQAVRVPKMTGGGLLSQLNATDTINPAPMVQTAPPPPEELPKKPRGRAKKEETKEAQAAPQVMGMEATAKPIRILYCDCLPLRNGHIFFAHELIAKAAAAVCADMQVLNIKLIDFGKGGACLSAQLEADILALDPGFDLALTTRTVEGREVYQTLMSLAQHIVVGL